MPENRVHQHLETSEGDLRNAERITAPLRILIVDNDVSSADSLEHMLRELGYSRARVAYSDRAALTVAEEFRPDVVLLELNLLDMGGYELARLLRQHAQSQELRLIALTSSREHADREFARSVGFERYLLKPIGVADLADLLGVQPQTP